MATESGFDAEITTPSVLQTAIWNRPVVDPRPDTSPFESHMAPGELEVPC